MKLALCTEILYPLYGVERRVYEFARRLPKFGFDVEVLTSTKPGVFKKLKIIQVSHCTITNPPRRNYAFCLAYQFSLFRQLMRRDYDLVHAEGHLSLIPVSLAASMRKKPSVATIHDLYLTEWSSMYKSAASLVGPLFELASCKMPFDHVLTVNSALKEKMTGALRIPSRKVEILHSGIDAEYIKSIKQTASDGSIVYVGRLVPQKNVDMLIRAYAALPDNIKKKYELKIIGEGSEMQKLESLAKSLGIRVNFTGKIEGHEDVLKELKKSSLFVLPSRRESFGITILEAMCSGVPVISTATEGPSDHIKNRKTGFLVSNEKEMTRRVEEVLSSSSLQKSLSKNGKRYAERHDWENITKNVAAVYRKVYESRR